jgi:hypothetical protein
MSKILVNCNLQSGDWTVQEEDIQPHYTDVRFYFSDGNSVVMFDNLTFGVKLKKDAEELFNETYGITKRFVASENTLFDNWIENARLYLEANTTYTLELWCENSGIMRTHNHEFTTPDMV